MFTKSQAEKLAKYIWDGDDYWSNKLKELVLDDEQGKSSTFLMSSELSFDEACRKGVIRFEIEEIDDNCDPPCFLIFPEDKREHIDSFSILIDCHNKNSIIDKYKVKGYEVANCLFHIINGVNIAEIGNCMYSCSSVDVISECYNNTSLMFSINRMYVEEEEKNPFENYAFYNEQIAKKIQGEIYKVLPCLHVTEKNQLSLEEMLEEAYLSFIEDTITPRKMGRKCWITCIWDFLVEDAVYISVYNLEDKQELKILSDYIIDKLDESQIGNNNKTLYLEESKEEIQLPDGTATMLLFQVDDYDLEYDGFDHITDKARPESDKENVKELVHFYIDSDTASFVVSELEHTKVQDKHIDFEGVISFDIIELPFYIRADFGQSSNTFCVYTRNELGVNLSDPAMQITKFSDGTESELQDDGRIGGNSKETLNFFISVATNLVKYSVDKDLLSDFKKYDVIKEGILVETQNGKIKLTVVEGKKRPTMACLNLFGSVEMKRPYQDEIMDYWTNEMQSFDQNLVDAKNGNMTAMDYVATAYLNGDEIEQDPTQAAYWYRRLANKGDATAAFNLGLLYGKGFGVKRDLDKAMVCMDCAHAFGDTDAKAWSIKFKDAIKDLRLSENGDAEAQARLAAFYMIMGRSLDQAGPEDDYEQCIYWAKTSEKQNCAEAMWVLALAYENGRGVNQDTSVAIDYYKKGAELKHAGCMHSLGCYYIRGENVEKNNRKAFGLFKESAELGYGLAMRDVGRCYQFATGTPGNMKTAVEWYEKALEVIDDPELEQKTALFKMMGESEPDFGEDYPEDIEA